MHQVMVSSSDANGSDLGLRQAYGPLFDQYGVDLVLCGHEHDYERSLAVRGVVSGAETLTPNPVSAATDDIESEHGTVHMILGGGGVTGTTNQSFFTDGTGKVITAVSATPGANGKRTATYVKEKTVWSAVRDVEHPYGFAAFTVDPGTPARGPHQHPRHVLQREQAPRRAERVRAVHPAPPPVGPLTGVSPWPRAGWRGRTRG